jgi:hypothetical protein
MVKLACLILGLAGLSFGNVIDTKDYFPAVRTGN